MMKASFIPSLRPLVHLQQLDVALHVRLAEIRVADVAGGLVEAHTAQPENAGSGRHGKAPGVVQREPAHTVLETEVPSNAPDAASSVGVNSITPIRQVGK